MKFVNHIGIFENAFDKNFCTGMIEFFDQKNSPDATNEMYEKNRIDVSLAPSKFGSYNNGPHVKKLDRILSKKYTEYRKKYITPRTDMRSGESLGYKGILPVSYDNIGYKIQKSQGGGGFCAWHQEYVISSKDEISRRRFLVWMIYLNDVTKGGKTEFWDSISVEPKQGTLVMWPAYFTHAHRSAPDLQQDKYIMTGWYTWNNHKDQ